MAAGLSMGGAPLCRWQPSWLESQSDATGRSARVRLPRRRLARQGSRRLSRPLTSCNDNTKIEIFRQDWQKHVKMKPELDHTFTSLPELTALPPHVLILLDSYLLQWLCVNWQRRLLSVQGCAGPMGLLEAQPHSQCVHCCPAGLLQVLNPLCMTSLIRTPL